MKHINILLIEDNRMDIVLTQKILGDCSMPYTLHIAQNGEEALKFLESETQPRPDIIFLDINMPIKDGKETLEAIKTNNLFKTISVIMLTSSEAEQDIQDCYELGANSYVIKPSTIQDHKHLITAIEAFWFELAVLPAASQKSQAQK